jgi:methylated-DNA-[protein]-cysteine S-methyltransferase
MAASNSHNPNTPPPPSIIDLASRPDVDPCDVACDAMPGFVLGDLTTLETSWVHDHTEHCLYCQNVLHTYESLDSAIGDVARELDARTANTAPPSAARVLGLREASYGIMESPVGPIVIAVTDNGVCDISYLEYSGLDGILRDIEARGILASERPAYIQPVVDQLSEYFAHQRTQFFLPIDLHGVTPFTRSVLEVTNSVPFGTVVTYGQVAAGIGQPGASRAVGNALGRNPVAIVVPCHRVIKSDGSMGWYTGGPHIKESLLGVEGVDFSTSRPPTAQQSLGL